MSLWIVPQLRRSTISHKHLSRKARSTISHKHLPRKARSTISRKHLSCKARSDASYTPKVARVINSCLPITLWKIAPHTLGFQLALWADVLYLATHQASKLSREEKGVPREATCEGEHAIRRTCTFPLFERHQCCPQTDSKCLRGRAESSFKGDLPYIRQGDD